MEKRKVEFITIDEDNTDDDQVLYLKFMHS